MFTECGAIYWRRTYISAIRRFKRPSCYETWAVLLVEAAVWGHARPFGIIATFVLVKSAQSDSTFRFAVSFCARRLRRKLCRIGTASKRLRVGRASA